MIAKGGEELQWNWKELALVCAIILVASLSMWWRFLPLPNVDLSFYTEPAYLLAKFGILAGPGSQHVDLTYQKGIYNYPPGYYLLLAGWIKLFGLSADSLLGYVHFVHLGVLLSLWALIRFRYGCSRLVSSLMLIALFPKAPHGRPDLTACLFSIAAWLALPKDKNSRRIVISGALAGATLLVSPSFGAATIATLVVLMSLNDGFQWKERLRFVVGWLATAGLTFTGISAMVLAWQHSWTLAYAQFSANLVVRGKQLNQFPDARLLYFWVFSFIPFVLIAVVPAIHVAIALLRNRENQLRDVALAFLAGTAAWFALDKSQLLMGYHYLFAAKCVFLAVFCSYARAPLWLRVSPLLILLAISWYLFKEDYLYLTTPLRAEEARFSPDLVPPGERAVDSLYFPQAYKPGTTLNYEPYLLEQFWPLYEATIPPKLRPGILSGLPETPATPSVFVISALSATSDGKPNLVNLKCSQSPDGFAPLKLLGRIRKLPTNPYAFMVCVTPNK